MPLILGTNSIKDTGYDVANSLRFNDGSSDHLKRTIGSNGSKRTFTFSAWFKRSELSSYNPLFGHISDSGNDYFAIGIDNNDKLFAESIAGGNNQLALRTNRLFRDPSAFYNVVVKVDTTQATESNRAKLYINGVQETSFVTSLIPSQNADIDVNVSGEPMVVGGMYDPVNTYFDGYMAEVVFIDGTAYDQTSFGEFDEDSPNIWKPKNVSGLTFGTNGFYLDFENSSNLGADVSGNGNNFTVNNLTSVDQSTDTCTNNFATLNPLDPSPNTVVFSEGNLVVTGSGGNGGRYAGGTFSLNSGKWWCEIKVTTNGSYPILGIIDSRSSFKRDGIYMTEGSQTAQNRSAYAVFSNSDIYNNGDNNFGDFGTTYTTGDIIGVGLNLDASPPTLTFQKNGSNEVTVNVEVPPSGFYTFPAIGLYYASAKAEVNFGNSPFSISSGVADANGYGLFEYTPKSGYYSCCTKNLAEFG